MLLIVASSYHDFHKNWTKYIKQLNVKQTNLFLFLFRISPNSTVSFRSSRPDVFCKKGVARNFVNLQENACARVFFLIKLQACEFCEISKNAFFTEHHWWLLLKILNTNNFIFVFQPCRLIYLYTHHKNCTKYINGLSVKQKNLIILFRILPCFTGSLFHTISFHTITWSKKLSKNP